MRIEVSMFFDTKFGFKLRDCRMTFHFDKEVSLFIDSITTHVLNDVEINSEVHM